MKESVGVVPSLWSTASKNLELDPCLIIFCHLVKDPLPPEMNLADCIMYDYEYQLGGQNTLPWQVQRSLLNGGNISLKSPEMDIESAINFSELNFSPTLLCQSTFPCRPYQLHS
jgi:hypothetical protein